MGAYSTFTRQVSYVISLVSNISAAAAKDAAAVEASNKRMTDATGKTDKALGQADKTAERLGKTLGQDVPAAMDKTERKTREVEKSTRALQRAVDEAMRGLSDNTTTERHLRYLDKLAQGYDRVRDRATAAAKAATAHMRDMGALGGGAAASLYMADRLMQRPMDFDLELRYAASTAYGGKSEKEILAGMNKIRGVVDRSVQKFGGDRNQALRGYNSMVGSGEFSAEEAEQLLPVVTEAAVATKTDVETMANLAMRVKSIMKVQVKDMRSALSKMTRVGDLGGVELPQQSTKIPDLAAHYQKLGYEGQLGAVKAAVDLNLAYKASGSVEGARTILDNIYGKILSQDTANDFKKLGVDLYSETAKRRAKGLDAVEAFVQLSGEVLEKQGKDKQLQRLLAGMDPNSKDYEQRVAAVKQVYESAGIGKFLQDKESLSGYLMFKTQMNSRDRMVNISMGDTGQTLDTRGSVIQSAPSVRRQKAIAEGQIAADAAFEAVEPAVSGAYGTATQAAQNNPELAKWAAGATGAALTAAPLGAAWWWTRRGSNTAPLAPKATPGLAWPVLDGAAPAAGNASKLAATVRAGSKWVPYLGGALEAYDLYSIGSNEELTTRGKAQQAAHSLAGLGGAWAGMKLGALGGTLVAPGAGTLVGALGGAVAGYWGGGYLMDSIFSPNAKMDYVQATAPQARGSVAAPTVQVGQGTLDVKVSVQDDRVSVRTGVLQQPDLVRIQTSDTNPGSYPMAWGTP